MDSIVDNYFFHYSSETKNWTAVHKNDMDSYWKDPESKQYLKSQNIKTLLELIVRGEEFIRTIQQTIK